MARKRSDDSGLRPGDRVIAVEAIGKIPEGTGGVVKLVNGFKWTRYWVAWDTGDWMGSVDGAAVVAARRYEQYKRERSEAAQRPAPEPAEASANGGSAAGATAAKAGGGSAIPEHLLERSRQARARKAAAGG